jgi:hypothetical protein
MQSFCIAPVHFASAFGLSFQWQNAKNVNMHNAIFFQQNSKQENPV